MVLFDMDCKINAGGKLYEAYIGINEGLYLDVEMICSLEKIEPKGEFHPYSKEDAIEYGSCYQSHYSSSFADILKHYKSVSFELI
jgi:hypothetical protein